MTHTNKGAAGELIAAAFLLRLGYEVFRAVSPSCPCDLVIMNQARQLFRVEVKCGPIYNPRRKSILSDCDALVLVPEAGEPTIHWANENNT